MAKPAHNITRRFVSVTALLLVAATIAAQPSPQPRPQDRFISVNGVRLHYLDWGGQGDTLLFLTGLGDTAHRFDSFAPQFTDRFRVLGLTRRGQGASDKPSSGYDTETLADDIGKFLTALRIQRASLIGHSIAGVEMTWFAIAQPERVERLVYLDASIDPARDQQLAMEANLPPPPGQSETVAAVDRAASQTHLDYEKITSPALAFFVLLDVLPVTPQMDENTRKWLEAAFRVYEPAKRQSIQMFKTKVRRGRVIELRGTDHFFFQDPARTAEVTNEIRTFLLSN